MFRVVYLILGLVSLGAALQFKGSSNSKLEVSRLAMRTEVSRLALREKSAPKAGLINSLCAKHEGATKCQSQINADSPNLCEHPYASQMCVKHKAPGATFERCSLPQLPQKPQENQNPTEARKAWLQALDKAGMESSDETGHVSSLIDNIYPSQARIDECRTCKIALDARKCLNKQAPHFPTHAQCQEINKAWAQRAQGVQAAHSVEGFDADCFCSWDADISVMEDGQILDGHHRYAATWLLLQDADTPSQFSSTAWGHAEYLVSKKGKEGNNYKGISHVIQAAEGIASKTNNFCPVPTNPDQAVCFQQCGLAFLQLSE